MSLMEENEDFGFTPVPPKPNPEPYKGVAVDTEEIPFRTLLTHIQGYRYIVKWFHQVLGKDSEYSAHQLNRNPIYQQYQLIHDLEIKIQDPLPATPSFSSENMEGDVRIRGIIYPGTIKPNPGDMFIGSLPNGRPGLFQCAAPIEPKSIFDQTAWSFEAILKNYLSEDEHHKLMNKVVLENYFIRDNLDTGNNPLITSEENGIYEDLQEYRQVIPKLFFDEYYNPEYGTLLVPGQPRLIYDPFITRFISDVFNMQLVNQSKVRNISTMAAATRRVVTIFDIFREQRPERLRFALTRIPVIDTHMFRRNPIYNGIRVTGVDSVIFPISNGNMHQTNQDAFRDEGGWDLVPSNYLKPNVRVNLHELFQNETLQDNSLSSDYKLVTADDYYIFSEAFYGHEEGEYSLVEAMVWSVLEGRNVNPRELLRLFREINNWPSLERFYFLPILYWLIPAAIRGN